MKPTIPLTLSLLAATSLVACGGAGGTPPGGSASPVTSAPGSEGSPSPPIKAARGGGVTSSNAHDVKGRIAAIARDRRAATLDLEAISGVMPAMKMEYRIADSGILEGLAAGDTIEGRIEERDGGYVVVALRKRRP